MAFSKTLNTFTTAGFLSLAILLPGCFRTTPRAQPIELPSAALEAAITQEDEGIIRTPELLPPDWWLLFGDPQLTSFIQTALERNPTLQKAQAAILSSIYDADRARAVLFPTLDWGADVSRQKLSENGYIPVGGKSKVPVYFTQYETELTLKYEFDIWQKNRNNLLAARGAVYAKIADEAFSRLQLCIAVARAYYNLQIDYRRLEILQGIVDSQEAYLNLIQQRTSNNLSNNINVNSTKFNLASYRQMLQQTQGDAAINENQLRALLAGDFTDEINKIDIAKSPLPQVPVPDNLPLHLLSYRPDITSQLWLIESAGRRIDVAKAGFYPDFNIMALWGYQSIIWKDLFTQPSTYMNVDPAVSLPIFDGGRLLANLGTSEVNYDTAILDYNNLVLNAVREVLDGVALVRIAEKQLNEDRSRVNAEEQVFNLTNLRISQHIASKLDYLSSEQNLLLAQDQEMITLGNKIQSMLSLIKALGGGYTTCDEEEG